MVYRVNVSRLAQQDAEDSALYIRQRGGTESAERWLRILLSEISALKSMPQKFARIPESNELRIEYRQFIHFSHRVVYRIEDETKTVFVVRIYQGARKPLTSKDFG